MSKKLKKKFVFNMKKDNVKIMKYSKDAFKSLMVVFHITDRCDLNCSYCYSKKSGKNMPMSIAYKAVDFVSKLHKNYDSVTIAFSGGEPLIVFKNVQKIVKYAQTQAGINNFIICTNGVNVDAEKIHFFVSNNISPTISLDGILKAQNLNRPSLSGKETWKKINKVLDFFTKYTKDFDKRVPDYLRIRCTFTPETIYFLDQSIHYLANKSISKIAMITLMPGMLPPKRWEILSKDKSLISVLNNQMKNIIDFYIKKQKENNPFHLCINECLTVRLSDFINFQGKIQIPFCDAGIDKLGISLSGQIYPCYLFAARPKENEEFCMGDIFNGFKSRREIVKVCNKFKENKSFSCLYWNYKENGDPNIPALVFRALYQSWQKAILNNEKNNI
jgi:sulfatase maturation enzyme AslB (radical SAM superfamily)